MFEAHSPLGVVVGVFDGHGHSTETADVCAKLFQDLLCGTASGDLTFADPTTALTQAFAHVAAVTSYTQGGSTALVGILSNTGRCTFATLGDSIHVVLHGRHLYVGPQHNIWTNTVEREAAVARGGFYMDGGRYIYSADGRYGLQCSRSFGDSALGDILSKEPEITTRDIPQGSWVALMSDGVLDPAVHSNEFEHDLQVFASQVESGIGLSNIMRRLQARKGDDATLIICRHT
jgi:serine/threonine protein phosphatase PrpC